MKIPFLCLLLLLTGTPPATVNLDEGIQLYQKGHFKQSVASLEKVTKSSPQESDARLWLGKAYLKIRDWSNAVDEMEKAVELQPSNAHYHLWLGRAYGAKAEHSFFSAFSLARKVIKEFRTARDLAPKDLDIRFDMVEFYSQAPGLVGGSESKAAEEAQEIAKLNPAKGYIARSIIFRNDKKWDQAKKELTQATVEYPTADSYKDLAEYLFDRNEYKGALDNAGKALELNSESKGARFLAAASSIRLTTDLDNAVSTLQEMANGVLKDEDPSFEAVYYWLGEGYLAKGDKENARKAFESALTFNPDYDEAKKGVNRSK